MSNIPNNEKYSNKSLTQDLGKAGVGKVDLCTGKLKFVHTDVAFNYGNPKLSLSHVYDGSFSDTTERKLFGTTIYTYGLYGNGWKLGFEKRVIEKEEEKCLIYMDSEGRVSILYRLEDGVENRYIKKNGISATAVYVSLSNPVGGIYKKEDGSFVQFDEKGNTTEFNTDGNIVKITTNEGKSLRFNYVSGVLTRIIGTNARQIMLTYGTVNDKKMLTGITDTAGRSYSYQYDNNNNLTSITHVRSNRVVVDFSYNNDNHLYKIKDESCFGYIYSYNEDGKVKKVTEHVSYEKIAHNNTVNSNSITGNSESISYVVSNTCPITTVKNNTGLYTTYHFKSDNELYYYNQLSYEGENVGYGSPRKTVHMRTNLHGKRVDANIAKNNFLTNPSFEEEDEENLGFPKAWTIDQYDGTASLISNQGITEGTKCLVVPNGKNCYFSQTINNEVVRVVNGKEQYKLDSGLYTLMLWAKGMSDDQCVWITLEYKYENEQNPKYYDFKWWTDYDYNIEEWQCGVFSTHIKGSINVALEDRRLEYIKVVIECDSANGTTNSFYIDNMAFIKDNAVETEQEAYLICYDESGNNPVIKKLKDLKDSYVIEKEATEAVPDFKVTENWIINAQTGMGQYDVDLSASYLIFDGDETHYPLSRMQVVYGGRSQSEDSGNLCETVLDAELNPVMQKVWDLDRELVDNNAFVTQNEFDGMHRMIKSTDHRNLVSETIYTEQIAENTSQVENLSYANGNRESGPVLYTKSVKTVDGGAVKQETDEVGNTTSYSYQKDSTDNELFDDLLYESTLPDGTKYQYRYDDFGNISELICNEHNYKYYYTLGYRTKVVVDDSITFTYDYDGRGNVVSIKHDGEEIYYALYRVSACYEEETDVNYKIVSKYGKTYKTTYNKRGQIVTISEQGSNGSYKTLAKYEYNPITDECITIQDYVNSSDEAEKIKWEFVSTTNYQNVKASGDIAYEHVAISNNGTVESESKIMGEDSQYISYTYDDDTNKGRYPDARLVGLAVTGATAEILADIAFTYDSLGRMFETSYKKGTNNIFKQNTEFKTSEEKSSNLVSKLTTTIYENNTANVEEEYSYSYDYDGKGNIVREVETQGETEKETTYVYDEYGQLIRENNQALDKTFIYEYDGKGNISKKVEIPYTTTEDLDIVENKPLGVYCGELFSGEGYLEESEEFTTVNNVVAKVSNYEYDGNKLIKAGDVVISNYDNSGNPSLYNGKTLTWDGARLKSFGAYNFEYDVRGYRTKKTWGENVVKYLYDESGKLLREERTENGDCNAINYIYNGSEVIGFSILKPTGIDSESYAQQYPFYFVKDALGNVRRIIDKNGETVVNYNYDAWGNMSYEVNSSYEFSLHSGMIYTADTIRKFNSFTYRSYYYDKDVQLYYLVNRYYDSSVGRFISIDDTKYLDFEVLFGYNRYAYCCNNPVMGYDPEGTWGFWERLFSAVVIVAAVVATVAVATVTGAITNPVGQAVVGGVIGAATSLFEQTVIEGKSLNEVDGKDVAISAVSGALQALPGVGMFVGAAISAGASAISTAIDGGSLKDVGLSFATSFATSLVSGLITRGVGLGKIAKTDKGNYAGKKILLNRAGKSTKIDFSSYNPKVSKQQSLIKYIIKNAGMSGLSDTCEYAAGDAVAYGVDMGVSMTSALIQKFE